MDAFALRALSYGVYVVSAMDAGRPTGCTANSAMQITSAPATIAVSVNHDNHTNGCIAKSGRFSVSVLGESCDPAVIGNFGFSSGRDRDKYESIPHEIVEGVPVLRDCCAYLVCRVIDKLETSTHTVFLGEVIAAEQPAKDTPMTYAYYHSVVKGKSPKNAPTYIAEEAEAAAPKKTAWKCTVCGYVYDGETPFEALPDDWKCPICGVPKSKFVQVEL